MSHSAVSICNNALLKLGSDTITALTEASDNASLCNGLYESNRDALLRLHPWNFAIKRASLALSTIIPSYGYANQFALPTDCLRVLSTEENYTDFKIEGRFLLVDDSTIKIKYISQVTDPAQFDELFSEVLSSRLAREMAVPITKSRTLMETMDALYKRKLTEAKTTDGSEGKPEELVVDSFLRARR